MSDACVAETYDSNQDDAPVYVHKARLRDFRGRPKDSTRAMHYVGSVVKTEQRQKAKEAAALEAVLATWLHDTVHFSSASQIKAHPSFGRLVDIGPPAAAHILRRMAGGDMQVNFFPVLKAVTNADPVPPNLRGFVPEMTQAWVTWGRKAGWI